MPRVNNEELGEMKPVEKEEQLDINLFVQVVHEQKKQVGCIIIGCMLISAIIAFTLPKEWESTTLVQLRSSDSKSTNAGMLAGLGIGGSSSNTPANYIELMKSRRVLQPIIDQMEWDDEKEKPDPETFASKYIDIQNKKQTNLITIVAKGRTPNEAQLISQSIADNFLDLQTDSNQQTQSLQVKFLNDRIDEAKKEAEDSRVRFAEYQQAHKVYSPDEQAKVAVGKMNAIDDAISNIAVQKKANQAKLDAVSAKLGDIQSNSHIFNINDNEIVMALRKQIVDEQVHLVTLQESYTEEHPSVISAKEKIATLQNKLSEEVNTIVASKYTTINPTQASLIREEANAQVSMAVAQASEEAIKERKVEKEKELDDFPKDVLEYLNLQRDTAIKEEIYTNLVKQCEQRKINEAMESMDIQIIDFANLPEEDKPKGPRKKIIILIGLIVGGILSMIYSMNIYLKKE